MYNLSLTEEEEENTEEGVKDKLLININVSIDFKIFFRKNDGLTEVDLSSSVIDISLVTVWQLKTLGNSDLFYGLSPNATVLDGFRSQNKVEETIAIFNLVHYNFGTELFVELKSISGSAEKIQLNRATSQRCTGSTEQ